MKKEDFSFTLSKDATREIVAELAFVTMTKVPTVTFTTALQYNDKENITSTRFNPTLGQKIFGLHVKDEWGSVDRWGRPGYEWYSGGKFNNTYTGMAYNVVVGSSTTTRVAPTNDAYAIMEIYITPDPDVTPSDEINAPVATGVQAGPNVSFPSTQPATDAGVTSGTRDIVIFSPSYKPDADLVTAWNIPDGSVSASSLIYFPFTIPTGNTATLMIRNAATNDLVYSETTGSLSTDGLRGGAGDAHAFVINYKNAAANASGYAPGLPLNAGVTYNFSIVSTISGLNVTLSNGSFTMN